MSGLDLLDTEQDEFDNHFPDIMKIIQYKKLHELEPTIDEISSVFNIISKFIKQKKRKVYGGFALNLLLKSKKKDYAIYDDNDTPDIEFYSPKPIDDLVELCDLLNEKGYKYVMGQEAHHKETYSIFVNYQLYCDISYMPSNIYNKVRYIQMDGYNLIHPWFMLVDYFRMFTDPLVSYWRLDKHFNRYLRLQKTYPLPKINDAIKIGNIEDKMYNEIIDIFEDYLSTKDSIIFTGFYAYNYYIAYAKYNKINKNFKKIPMLYLEVYSEDYIKDGLEIIDFIETLDDRLKSKISYKEFYPFFQFYGFNTVFYYNDGENEIPVLYLYSNDKKCLPYKEVEYIKFKNSDQEEELVKDRKINLGSFDLNILHSLIILVKVRVDDDQDWNDYIYKLINGFVRIRNYYLKENKKSIYDDTLFQGFVIQCKGETMEPERKFRLMIEYRKKKDKKPLLFRYEPGRSKAPTNYNFPNSSGNEINNEKMKKLKLINLENNSDNELETDSDEDNDNKKEDNNINEEEE